MTKQIGVWLWYNGINDITVFLQTIDHSFRRVEREEVPLGLENIKIYLNLNLMVPFVFRDTPRTNSTTTEIYFDPFWLYIS